MQTFSIIKHQVCCAILGYGENNNTQFENIQNYYKKLADLKYFVFTEQ